MQAVASRGAVASAAPPPGRQRWGGPPGWTRGARVSAGPGRGGVPQASWRRLRSASKPWVRL